MNPCCEVLGFYINSNYPPIVLRKYENIWDVIYTCVFSADASTYAHYLFNAFDSSHNGSIKFEVQYLFLFFTFSVLLLLFLFVCQQGFMIVSAVINHSSLFLSLCQDFVRALSILLRGTTTEKLQWTFNLYDINRDGYINKEVCVSVLTLHLQ